MIDLKHINKYYGDFHVTKDLNLHIKKGEIYGLIGKNGAGKTTIFKIILGLSDFSDGQLSIKNSKNYSELLTNRKKIGFFIGKNFFDYLNAKENLEYYRKLKGIEDKKEIDRVLKIVGLHTTTAKYKSFSMGMKQRLGIASAILGNPEILILDEPTNGLDPVSRLGNHYPSPS
ncbi:ATP-binding cassette domain-containing protein [Clostridium sp.]|uniref:ABC transporter ATP-binding protein n=1 Tax=Clostridium sp. TaxID=1506 RepID=UPI003217EC81